MSLQDKGKSLWGHMDECITISVLKKAYIIPWRAQAFKLIIQMSKMVLERNERVSCVWAGKVMKLSNWKRKSIL